MANKNKAAAGANHFALLETDDPGDKRVEQPEAAPNLTQELFGYPSAWEIMKSRQKQQYNNSAPPPANAKAPADSKKKKGAQGQGSSGKGAAANDGAAPAPRWHSLAEFPSLK